ncbi:MAG: hypothetical protein JJU29_14405 [Verrucomicrobia bacterium]|nr:hypothetical protein [Verrucomicrobiota bacterium]MCH8513295.1 hypothetical protein [Kiritimatiellia bacterium]
MKNKIIRNVSLNLRQNSTLCLLFVFLGCTDTTLLGHNLESYNKAKDDALRSVDVIKDFHGMYPDAIGHFSYYTGVVRDTIWGSTTYLHGRYILVMRVPVELSDDRTRIVGSGEPTFHLRQVTHIDILEDGRFSQHLGKGWQFDHKKWKELKNADGRIEDVFPNISTDKPVPRFDQYEEHMRSLRD